MPPPLLLVLADRPWSGATARLHHLTTRLAGRWRVLVVEPPAVVPGGEAPALRLVHAAGRQLQVWQPRLPAGVGVGAVRGPSAARVQPGRLPRDWRDGAAVPVVAGMLARRLAGLGGRPDVAWVADPRAWPLVDAVGARASVYACRQDPRLGTAPPLAWVRGHATALRRASLVLAAGPSLQQTLRRSAAPVHCWTGSVDAAGFDPARLDPSSHHAAAARSLQGGLPGPRLGCFATLDDRVDLTLLAMLADRWPDGSVVVAGPIERDEASLPRRPNLHWLGLQPYGRLPHLLAGWDVALIPYESGSSMRLASPDKTLEYFAGEKPVVATALPDVELLWGEALTVARGRADFVDACAAVLAESAAERCRRQTEMLTTVAMHDWGRTADSVHQLLARLLGQARAAGRTVGVAPAEGRRIGAGSGVGAGAARLTARVAEAGGGRRGLGRAHVAAAAGGTGPAATPPAAGGGVPPVAPSAVRGAGAAVLPSAAQRGQQIVPARR